MSKKWRPGECGKFWCIEDWHVFDTIYSGAYYYRKYIRMGNCFRTRAEAERALKKIKAILKSGEIK